MTNVPWSQQEYADRRSKLPVTHAYVDETQRNAPAHQGNRGIPAALTSSNTPEHQTPFEEFNALDREFGPFTLDPATALGYHTSDVILSRGGTVCTTEGVFRGWYYPPNEEDPNGQHGAAKLPSEAPDGLAYEWTGRVWLNPPYSNKPNDPAALWRWIRKAWHSVREGDADLVCAYIPVKSEQPFWQRYIASEIAFDGFDNSYWVDTKRSPQYRGADVIRFIDHRPKFVAPGNASASPDPCAVVVWRK